MTSPIRIGGQEDSTRPKKAARWDALVAGGMSPDDATTAVEHEFGGGRTTSLPGFAAESTRQISTPELVQHAGAQMRANTKGTLRQAAQGATLGFADEIEAAGRAALGPRSYDDVIGDIRQQNTQFAQDHPVMAGAAQLAGGLMTGGAVQSGAAALGRLPGVFGTVGGAVGRTIAPAVSSDASMLAKIGAGAKSGAFQGAVAGYGNAGDYSALEQAAMAAGGAVLGGTVGAIAAPAVEKGLGALDRLRSGKVPAGTPGASMSRAKREAGREFLAIIRKEGQSLDDLEAASRTAARQGSLAESIAKARGVAALRKARNNGNESDLIDAALGDRAANAAAWWGEELRSATGIERPASVREIVELARKRAQEKAGPLYRQIDRLPEMKDKDVAEVVDMLGQMKRGGSAVLGDAHDFGLSRGTVFPKTLRPAQPEVPTVTDGVPRLGGGVTEGAVDGIADDVLPIQAEQVHDLRQALDRQIETLRAQPGGERRAALFTDLRKRVDQALKNHGEAVGDDIVREADDIYSHEMRKGAAIKAGSRSRKDATEADLHYRRDQAIRLPDGNTDEELAEAFRFGVGNDLLTQAGKARNGTLGGRWQNPTAAAMADDLARARTRMAVQTPEDFDRLLEVATAIAKQQQVKNAVSGNSATMRNFKESEQDALGSLFSPEIAESLVERPVGTLGKIARRLLSARGKAFEAEKQTELGRLLLSGLRDQPTQQETITGLRDLLPSISKIYQRDAIYSGAAGRTPIGPLVEQFRSVPSQRDQR